MNKNFLIILILVILTFSCKFKDKTISAKTKAIINNKLYINDSLTNVLNSNKQYFKDSLLKDKSGIIENYFSIYQSDTCGIFPHKKSELKEGFTGIRIIEGIRSGKKSDTVFVIPSFNYCDDGESYCFYDKTLPRLHTNSYCCHPDNFFVCSDFDEDGINEIGIFYSSCVSRYKCLKIYCLRKNTWNEIAISTFDILTKDPTEVKFGDLVKKAGKDKFQICSFVEGQTKWETIKMK